MADTPISDTIARIIAHVNQCGRLSVKDGLALLGDNSIVIAILLFSLVNSLPLPSIPGFSTLTGIPIVLLGFQLLIGRDTLWLPDRFTAHDIHPGKWLDKIESWLPRLQRIERRMKPRLLALSAPPVRNCFGLAFIVLGTVLAMPIPFGNFLPGVTMSILAFGLIVRDGAVISVATAAIFLSSFALVSIVRDGIALLF